MTNCQLQVFGAGNADTEENQPGGGAGAKGTVSSPTAANDAKVLVKRIIAKIRALPGKVVLTASFQATMHIAVMVGQGTISAATVAHRTRSGSQLISVFSCASTVLGGTGSLVSSTREFVPSHWMP